MQGVSCVKLKNGHIRIQKGPICSRNTLVKYKVYTGNKLKYIMIQGEKSYGKEVDS